MNIFQKLMDRKKTAAMTFFELAKKIASGEEVAENEAENVLATSGKSVEQLQEIVALIQRYLAAADGAKNVDELNEKRIEIIRRQEAIHAELAQITKEFTHKLQAIDQEFINANFAYTRAREAKGTMWGLITKYPELVQSLGLEAPPKQATTPAPTPLNFQTRIEI